MTVERGVISLHSITTFCVWPAKVQFQTQTVIIYLAVGVFLSRLTF